MSHAPFLSRRNLLAASAAMAALGAARPVRSQGAPGQCIDAFTQEAVNFNPLLYVNTGVETAVEFSVFDALWQIDPQGNFLPNLAAELPTQANGGISADGRTWTIKLRQGVKQTPMNPKVAARSRNGQDHVDKYEAPDDHTVRITLIVRREALREAQSAQQWRP